MFAFLMSSASLLRRQSEASGCGGMFLFFFIVVGGAILFLMLRGRRDRPERLGASKRAMGSGPIADHKFPCPYPKCPTCSASGDKMKQQWDGLRKVTWTCGYCGNIAGVQDLKDEELPPSARQRLGLDVPRPGLHQDGWGNGGQGSGMGGLLTGMMIGSMMGGGHHHRDDGWSGDSSGGNWNDSGSGGDSGNDWGDSGGGDSGGDWGDSGGGDSGGDSGGGDSGGDW